MEATAVPLSADSSLIIASNCGVSWTHSLWYLKGLEFYVQMEDFQDQCSSCFGKNGLKCLPLVQGRYLLMIMWTTQKVVRKKHFYRQMRWTDEKTSESYLWQNYCIITWTWSIGSGSDWLSITDGHNGSFCLQEVTKVMLKDKVYKSILNQSHLYRNTSGIVR